MNNYKSFSELKEELGNNYDFKLYEMGISALKEIENLQEEIERLNNIIKEVREIFKDYGDKEDIVGYTMYNITGEQLINILDIVNKALGSDKE